MPELLLLHRWLDSWRGIEASMVREGWDLQLTEYGEGPIGTRDTPVLRYARRAMA